MHVAILCEQVSDRALFDPTEVEAKLLTKITCTGFSIGGNDEHEGVTLIGRREMKNNRILNLVAPFTKWEDENAEYKHSWELQRAINACVLEVELYLFEDKYAPDPQGELFPAGAEAETVAEGDYIIK